MTAGKYFAIAVQALNAAVGRSDLNVGLASALSVTVRLLLQLFCGWYLAPDAFSQFSLVWTGNVFVVSVLTSSLINYFYHYREDDFEKPVLTAIALVITAPTALLVTFALYFFSAIGGGLIASSALFFVTGGALEYARKHAITNYKFKSVYRAEVLYAAVVGLVVVVATGSSYPLTIGGIILIMSAANMVGCVSLGIHKDIALPEKRNYKSVYRFSYKLVLATLVQFFSGNYFVILTGVYVSFSVIGEISLVRNFFSPIIFAAGLIDIIYSRSLSLVEGEKERRRYTFKIASVGLLLSFLFMVVFFFVYQELIVFYDLAAVSESSMYVFIVFTLSHLLIVANRYMAVLLRASDKQSYLAYASVATAVFTVLLSDFLGARYGLQGLLCVMLAQQVIIISISVWGAYRANV